MKVRIIFIMLSCGIVFLSSETVVKAEPIDFGRLVEAVGRAEGSVKYPYGVKSINTHGDVAYARQICRNSAQNAWKRYARAHGIARMPIASDLRPFLGHWADRWCPRASDPSGHAVWARNVGYWYNKMEGI